MSKVVDCEKQLLDSFVNGTLRVFLQNLSYESIITIHPAPKKCLLQYMQFEDLSLHTYFNNVIKRVALDGFCLFDCKWMTPKKS